MIDGYPGQEHHYPITPKVVIQTTAESKMAYTPTLLVIYSGSLAENYFYEHEDPSNNQKLQYFTSRQELMGKARRRGAGWFHEEEYVMEEQSHTLKQIYDAGGIVGVGSHGQLQGPARYLYSGKSIAVDAQCMIGGYVFYRGPEWALLMKIVILIINQAYL